MSSDVKIPVWTWRDAIRKSKAPALTKHVCNCIANYLSDAGKGCWPTAKELLRDTSLGNKALTTHLKKGVEFGLLHVSRARGKDGRLGRYAYHPRFPDDTELGREAPIDGRPQRAVPAMTNFDRKIEGARRCRQLLRDMSAKEIPQ